MTIKKEMIEKKLKRQKLLVLSSFLIVGLFWSIILSILSYWTIKTERAKTTTIILTQARSFFKLIVATRYWNSLHGGVYVPITDKLQPNKYLDVPHRDVVTENGLELTLVNPAYMTRQIAEISVDREQVQFHITSLKLIRPQNLLEAWERDALSNFTKKTDEYYDWWKGQETGEKYFRYMAPLMTEKTCLSCHEKQGYSEGDIRGGISVRIPAGSILDARDSHTRMIIFSYAFIWLLGMAGLLVYFRLVARERTALVNKLSDTMRDVRILSGLIPICSSCKKIRNDEGYWDQLEKYITSHSEAQFSHGLCPDCVKKLYPGYLDDEKTNE